MQTSERGREVYTIFLDLFLKNYIYKIVSKANVQITLPKPEENLNCEPQLTESQFGLSEHRNCMTQACHDLETAGTSVSLTTHAWDGAGIQKKKSLLQNQQIKYVDDQTVK